MILGTEGHMAEGTSEKAIPNVMISTSASSQFVKAGTAKSRCTATIMNEPTSIIVAPLPLRS